MPRSLKFVALSVTLLAACLTYAQTDEPGSSSAPVAHVYVTRPTHLDAFDVSYSGKLTAVSGSPFSGISLFHISVNGKYLIGESDDHNSIVSYAIESNGAVTKAASIDANDYIPPDDGVCCESPQKLDATGSTLYTLADGDNYYLANFKIESNGDFSYLGATYASGGGSNYGPGMISILGNNKFAYQTGCNEDVQTEQLTGGFRRETSGMLQDINISFQLPKAKPGDVYCPYALATDGTDHLAFMLQAWNINESQPEGNMVLASYTADSQGNLTTESTASTMPAITGGCGSCNTAMSISPSGKLLAVAAGGDGFEVFHFDAADPVAKFTSVLHSSEDFLEFGWDKSNHLYALSQTALHIYSATPTSIKEEAGSPISIPEASSVIVQSLN